MVYRFGECELDLARRELRVRGVLRAIQPQAFAVLDYLVRHRDRVVPKRELLERLWPDVTVTDGSLQRAVSLARAAIDDDGARIRTVRRTGYRFEGHDVRVDGGSAEAPVLLPRFARSGDVHVAYTVRGEGGVDIVIVTGWVFPMRAFFEQPRLATTVRDLTRLGRVVLFDKRGTGMSDRVKQLPTLEQRIDDLRAVLDDMGSREVVLVGYSEGGPLAILFATSYPERTRGLLLAGAFARWTRAPGYEPGWPPERVAELRRYIATSWGAGRTIEAIAQSLVGDPQTAAWAARAEQEGASPGAALELLDMNLQIDVRPLLAAVAAPTVVLHRREDPVIPIDNARYLAAHIAGARLVEVEGRDHIFGADGSDELLRSIEWLLAGSPASADERFLTTVVAARADGALPPPAELDDLVARFRGARAGAGAIWSFDGPERAIRCAQALAGLLAARRVRARLGVHTGEVFRTPEALAGDGVATAVAVAGAASPGEVRVSRVVRDLVHGSALRFGAPRAVGLGRGREVETLASEPQGIGER